jgi:murein DD-endopeptidase MepM/ murein hydrolase activator NlpD
VGGLFGLGITLITGIVLIGGLSFKVGGLNNTIADLSENRDELAASNFGLMSEQIKLMDIIAGKDNELKQLSGDLTQIEMLVGLESTRDDGIHYRMDIAKQTAMHKRTMLDSIPSGFPLKDTYITSRYGNREHPVLNRDAFHKGVDLKAIRGTPVFASAEGVVEWSGEHKSSGLGRMVQLAHNFGFGSIYGHLGEIEVKIGQYVQPGDLLGYSGSSGLTDGPHLHYEVSYLNRRLNPAPFMEWNLENFGAIFATEEQVQWESLTEMINRKVEGQPAAPLLRQVQVSSAISP